MNYRTPTFIDKLSITIPVPRKDWDQVSENLHHFIYRNENLIPVGGKKLNKNYQFCWNAFIAGKGNKHTKYLIQIWPEYPASAFLRIEWNPSQVAPWATNEILKILSACIPNFSECLLKARVSRVDVTVDLHRVRMTDISAFTESARTTYDPKGKLGVINGFYLGAKQSNRRLLIYDKLLERTRGNPMIYQRPDGTESVVLRANKTRIEFRLRDVKLISNLHAIANPLSRYSVLSTTLARNYSDCEHWQTFVADIISVGAQVALQNIENRVRRGKYRKMLNSFCTPNWYKRDCWWEEAKVSIANAFPILAYLG
jgi:hypothetical protein